MDISVFDRTSEQRQPDALLLSRGPGRSEGGGQRATEDAGTLKSCRLMLVVSFRIHAIAESLPIGAALSQTPTRRSVL